MSIFSTNAAFDKALNVARSATAIGIQVDGAAYASNPFRHQADEQKVGALRDAAMADIIAMVSPLPPEEQGRMLAHASSVIAGAGSPSEVRAALAEVKAEIKQALAYARADSADQNLEDRQNALRQAILADMKALSSEVKENIHGIDYALTDEEKRRIRKAEEEERAAEAKLEWLKANGGTAEQIAAQERVVAKSHVNLAEVSAAAAHDAADRNKGDDRVQQAASKADELLKAEQEAYKIYKHVADHPGLSAEEISKLRGQWKRAEQNYRDYLQETAEATPDAAEKRAIQQKLADQEARIAEVNAALQRSEQKEQKATVVEQKVETAVTVFNDRASGRNADDLMGVLAEPTKPAATTQLAHADVSFEHASTAAPSVQVARAATPSANSRVVG